MAEGRVRWGALPALVLTLLVPQAQGPARGDSLVLVTLDGARIEEIFGGLDADILASTLGTGRAVEDHPLYARFYAPTPEERRARLMPFFWTELMAHHGSIAGNPRLQSSVTLANRHRFSYPGYSEILTGRADDERITSNDRVHNPNVTLLESLRSRLGLQPADVAVFGSWEVFNEIAEHTPGALTINAGYEPFAHDDPAVAALSVQQFETPTPWPSVRHDFYTLRFAMAHLRSAKPRVLYLALGETDDWAHDGRYDRVLEAYARSDAYLRELWTWLQEQPEYRGRTHVLLTTDHGRGRTRDDWRSHGARIEGAEDVWMAFVTPLLTRRGEWRAHPPLSASQAAATMAAWMGLDWLSVSPAAGRPVRD